MVQLAQQGEAHGKAFRKKRKKEKLQTVAKAHRDPEPWILIMKGIQNHGF
jgi:hypothetical protein